MITAGRLSGLFVEVANTLVDGFDLVDFLNVVAVHAAEITASSAVGLMLADHDGTLRHMASSTEDARLLELFQLQHSEGPCLECHRSGREVSEVHIASAVDRWPNFSVRALELGFGAAHCFPLRLRDQVIGAMNVFRDADQVAELDIEERRITRALADVATIALMQERTLRRAEELTEQLQFALNSRVVIEQAKGAVARTLDIGVDEAFVVLRNHARRNGEKLTELAFHVLEDRGAMQRLVSQA